MKFSIVIPLYNKAPYIQRAINSVLNQTYQKFELIVVDDGSTDQGADLVKKIPDPRVKLIQQENSGASIARNHGVMESEANYIAFLDADDEWKRDQLTIFKQLIEKYSECSFFAQSYEYRYQNRTIIPTSLRKIPFNWTGYLNNYLELAAEFPPFFSSSVCIRKDLIMNSGGFPEGVIIVEDISMWLKLFFITKIAFCHSLNSIYHFGETNNISLSQNLKFGYFEKSLEKYLIECNFDRKVKKDLYEYYTSRLLDIVSQCLVYESKSYCHSLLQKCNLTEKYKIRWYRLYTLSYLPNWVYKIMFLTWKMIKKF
jgi:glycosyltransferase involved in cell wall biosynthesis